MMRENESEVRGSGESLRRKSGGPGQKPKALSLEEADALDRSRKKVRIGGGGFSKDFSMLPREEEWMLDDEDDPESAKGVDSEQMVDGKEVSADEEEGTWAGESGEKEAPRKSYKAACTGACDSSADCGGEEDDDDDWWSNGRWEQKVKVEQTERGPNVIVSPEMKARLAKRWKLSLFVKLLGRMTNADYLGRKLQQIWARQGLVETIDIGSGYFLVSFKSREDLDFTLTGGPWLVQDHYLAVQRWKEDFDPDEEEISKIAAWIRFPKLAMDYYDKGMLYVLGSQVGKVLKLDMTTLQRKKGHFARICVELDLNKALVPSILINGKERIVEYEGIHLICFSCGKYGHDSHLCQLKNNQDSANKGNSTSCNAPEEVDSSKAEMATEQPKMGEWNLVQRARNFRSNSGTSYFRRDLVKEKREGSAFQARGSRFQALMDNAVIEDSHNHEDRSISFPLKDISNLGQFKGHNKTKGKAKAIVEKKYSGMTKVKQGSGAMDVFIRAKERLGINEEKLAVAGEDGLQLLGAKSGSGENRNFCSTSNSKVLPSSKGVQFQSTHDNINVAMEEDDNPIDPGSPKKDGNSLSVNHDDASLLDPMSLALGSGC